MKLINAKAASEILGISNGRVRKLVREGELKDYAVTKPDAQKHHARLSVTEVREYKQKNFVTRRGNGQVTEPEISDTVTVTLPNVSAIKSFGERLKMVEAKLDLLIKLWS